MHEMIADGGGGEGQAEPKYVVHGAFCACSQERAPLVSLSRRATGITSMISRN